MNTNEPNQHAFCRSSQGDEVECYQPGMELGNQILPGAAIEPGREADSNLAADIDEVPEWSTLPNSRLTLEAVFRHLRTCPAVIYRLIALVFRPAYPNRNPGANRHTTPHLLHAWLPPWEDDATFGEIRNDDATTRHWVIGTDPFGIFTLAEQTRRSIEDELEHFCDPFDMNERGILRVTRKLLDTPALVKPRKKASKKPAKKPAKKSSKRKGDDDESDDDDEQPEENPVPADPPTEAATFPDKLAEAMCSIRHKDPDRSRLFNSPVVPITGSDHKAKNAAFDLAFRALNKFSRNVSYGYTIF